ncbi:cysteine and tyrosine-rich protein 1-like [Saccostrea echinata]|uniref:cysteine and tyrosine-rich protein 1-like n=1 Tax=Saccostrea echinata TaxID=191078 RepID=UPI002A7EBC21|nr:cysteine and tyrosine-rich protein 1-like [Saccostrea echinata]
MAFTELLSTLPCVILFDLLQGSEGAYRYYYRYYSYYYYDYAYLSGGVIAGIVSGIVFFIVFIIVIVVCCCRAAQQRTRMPGVIYSNGMNQQTVITTANSAPGLYPTQPYPVAGQYNMGMQYGTPGQQFGVPGQQTFYPPQGQQYTDPAPSYESVTEQKTTAPPYPT